MIRIAITEAAFGAIASTLALGSVGYENSTNERGERLGVTRPRRDQPAQSHARSRRELQRCDPAHRGAGGRALAHSFTCSVEVRLRRYRQGRTDGH
jgi:hypothetical protein